MKLETILWQVLVILIAARSSHVEGKSDDALKGKKAILKN